jgi:hypothetical protein
MPAFSLDDTPRRVIPPLQCVIDAPLPLVLRRTHSFGSGLEPRYIVRAGPLDQ